MPHPKHTQESHRGHAIQPHHTSHVITIVAIVIIAAAAFAVGAGGVGITPDFEYECDENGKFTVTNTSMGVFSDASWEVQEMMGSAKYSGTGDVWSWTGAGLNTPGMHVYQVTLTVKTTAGISKTVTKDVVRDGYSYRVIEWIYNGDLYSIAISVNNSDFLHYESLIPDKRAPGGSVNAALVNQFVTTTGTTNGAFEFIVQQFKDQFDKYGLNGLEDQVNCIMEFVQTTGYMSDESTTGYVEYWKFPIETLIAQGDCEDMAMLTMALFRQVLGLDTALLVYWDINDTGEGHAMAAVNLEGIRPHPDQDPENIATGWYTTNGMTFCTCETTALGWDVGEIPPVLYNIPEDRIFVVMS